MYSISSQHAAPHKSNTMDEVLANCQCQNHGPFCLQQHEPRTVWSSGTHCFFDIRYLLRHPEVFQHPDVLKLYWFMTLALRRDRVSQTRFASYYGGYGLRSKEGFAGSSAEYVLNLLCSKNSKGQLVGRWVNGVNWVPGDADYFITAPTLSAYYERTDHLIILLKQVARALGTSLLVFEYKVNNYAHREYPIWTKNIQFEGIETQISFVSAPYANSMAEILDDFDISICKVMYDCKGTGVLITTSNVLKQIKKGEATVRNFCVHSSYPDLFECKSIASTLARMNKYGERGYTFLNYPRIEGVHPRMPE